MFDLFFVALETIRSFLQRIFRADQFPSLPGFQCNVCHKVYRSSMQMQKHKTKKHPSSSHFEATKSVTSGDQVLEHTHLLMKLLLLKSNMDAAIELGDGDRLMLNIKHMYLYFKANNNRKYALACFQLLSELNYFVSDKVALALKQDRFINMKGSADSNYPVDLLIEHSNKDFKENFHLYRGQPTQKALDRISKSQTMTTKILDDFQKEFAVARYISTHKPNEESHQKDLDILFNSLHSYRLFEDCGRQLRSNVLTVSDPISSLDSHGLLDWMNAKIMEIRTESYLR